MFAELNSTVNNYFKTMVPLFNDLASSTKHLYGDAKNRLQDKFAQNESALVNFIHMAKIKIVSALANIMVGISLGYNYFAPLIEVKLENISDVQLLNEHDAVENQNVLEFLSKLLNGFDEALAQAQKLYQ